MTIVLQVGSRKAIIKLGQKRTVRLVLVQKKVITKYYQKGIMLWSWLENKL